MTAQLENLLCTWLPLFCPFLIFSRSHRFNVWNYVSFQCPADPQEDRERGHSRIRPCSPPLFWFTPSPTFSFPPRSLSLTSSAPAVHQPPRSSPSCLGSPNEQSDNNAGQRSRERTHCTYNRPVAPAKTIAPFFSFTSLALLGLEKTNLWSGGRGGVHFRQNTLRGTHSHLSAASNNKHSFTHWFSGLSPHHPSVCPFGEASHCPVWAQS